MNNNIGSLSNPDQERQIFITILDQESKAHVIAETIGLSQDPAISGSKGDGIYSDRCSRFYYFTNLQIFILR